MSQHRTADFFDAYAGDFSAIYGTSNSPFNRVINSLFRKSMKLRFLKTIEGCDPIEGATVLDVGCGPGHYSVALARRGAASVYGVDFAPGMIELSRRHAREAGVEDRCRFETADFMEFGGDERFDYCVAMGFMDYMGEPRRIIEKVTALATRRAFFSMPRDGGFLAWQRKVRYRRRCDLYLYTQERIGELFDGVGQRVRIEPISRDYFVTVEMA